MESNLLNSPVAPSGAPTPELSRSPRTRGPFDKEKMAALDEAEDVARAAQEAPYADILKQKYAITPQSVAGLLDKIAQCEHLFGKARTSGLDSQSGTEAKEAARNAIMEAIDEFRTGARLSFQSDAELEAFGIGVNLNRSDAVLAQLAQTILNHPQAPTLRGISPDEVKALQSALDNWKEAAQTQSDSSASSQGTRARAQELFDQIEAQARDIKIAIDGKFSFRKPDSVEARKKFHLPINRPFAPRVG